MILYVLWYVIINKLKQVWESELYAPSSGRVCASVRIWRGGEQQVQLPPRTHFLTLAQTSLLPFELFPYVTCSFLLCTCRWSRWFHIFYCEFRTSRAALSASKDELRHLFHPGNDIIDQHDLFPQICELSAVPVQVCDSFLCLWHVWIVWIMNLNRRLVEQPSLRNEDDGTDKSFAP